MKVDEEKNLGDAVVDRETEPGFTPGPWKAVGYSPGWWQIEGPEREQIADVNYSDGADEPTLYPEEANARLIAAAPTLYAALRPFAEMDRENCDLDETACQRGIASDMTIITSEDFRRAKEALVLAGLSTDKD